MADLPANTLIHFPVGQLGVNLSTKPRRHGRGSCPTSITFNNSFTEMRGSAQHNAIDIYGAFGLQVVATVSGVVPATWSLRRDGRRVEIPGIGTGDDQGGFYVMIRDANGYYHYYAHLRSLPLVGINQPIRSGQLLGYLGDSGRARTTCQHLHYQVSTREGGYVYFNPYQELRRLALGLGGAPSGPSVHLTVAMPSAP